MKLVVDCSIKVQDTTGRHLVRGCQALLCYPYGHSESRVAYTIPKTLESTSQPRVGPRRTIPAWPQTQGKKRENDKGT